MRVGGCPADKKLSVWYTVEEPSYYFEPLKCRHFVLMDILLRNGMHSHQLPFIITLEIQTHSVSGQAFWSLYTQTVQGSLDNAHAWMPLTKGFSPLLIGEFWNMPCSIQQEVCIAMPTGNMEASKIQTNVSIFQTRSGSPWWSHCFYLNIPLFFT